MKTVEGEKQDTTDEGVMLGSFFDVNRKECISNMLSVELPSPPVE
jgi:hypothetical protein